MLTSTLLPTDSGSGDAPTTASERGRRSRASGGLVSCTIMSASVAPVIAEPGTVGFLVEELVHALLRTALRIAELRLVELRSEEFGRGVPRHFADIVVGALAGAQHDGVL